MRVRALLAVAVTLVVAVVAACSPGADDVAPDEARDDHDARIATIRELRDAIGPTASEVGTSAVTLGEAVAQLHAELPEPPDARRDAAADIRQRDVARLHGAAGALADVDLDPAPSAGAAGERAPGEAAASDVAAVAAARGDVVAAATSMAELAERELVQVALAADADERLEALVRVWDERGSRGETMERLAAAVATAEELAAELEPVEPVPPCSDTIARREDAARAVAAGSRELRELVADRRGSEFDARRDELLASPLARPATRVAADRAEADCHAQEGTPAAGAAVGDALEALEAALNPPDL